MTDYSMLLKQHAKAIRLAKPDLQISHGQAVELTVALITDAESWNHFSANPSPLTIPETLEDFFSAIGRGQRRLFQLKNGEPALDSRGRRSWEIMDAIAIPIIGEDYGLKAMWSLLERQGAGAIHTVIDGEVRAATFEDDASFALARLGSWFFQRKTYTYGQYPWDHTEKLALTKGFTPSQASLIRSLQREAPNHSWPLEFWFDVGVLDGDQDSFLNELKAETSWEEYFQELYSTDGNPSN
ncbi:MAG: hypothetical protein CMF39_05515 [Legionellaceae bacterium]|nr:hypothetical protein [Legionellaceae bacterium]